MVLSNSSNESPKTRDSFRDQLDRMSMCSVRSDNVPKSIVSSFESGSGFIMSKQAPIKSVLIFSDGKDGRGIFHPVDQMSLGSKSRFSSFESANSVLGQMSLSANDPATANLVHRRFPSVDHIPTVVEKQSCGISSDQEADTTGRGGPCATSRVGNGRPSAMDTPSVFVRGDQKAAPKEAQAPGPEVPKPSAKANPDNDSTNLSQREFTRNVEVYLETGLELTPLKTAVPSATDEQDDKVPPDCLVVKLGLQRPLIAVKNAESWDTLAGRGDGSNLHEGNSDFHAAKTALQPLYLHLPASNKSADPCKMAISQLLVRSRQGRLKDVSAVARELCKIKELMAKVVPAEDVSSIEEYIAALEPNFLPLFSILRNGLVREGRFLRPIYFDDIGLAYENKEKANMERLLFEITDEKAILKASQALRTPKPIKTEQEKEWPWIAGLAQTQLWKNFLHKIIARSTRK